MRLWELEGGDEHGQNVFAGGRAAEDAQPAARNELELAEIALEAAIVGDDGVDNGDGRNVNVNVEPERPVRNANGVRVDVAREGPLVLRIDAGAPAAHGARGGQQEARPPQQVRGGAQNRHRANPAIARQQQLQIQQGQRGRGGRGRGFGHRHNPNQVPNRRVQDNGERLADVQVRDEAGPEELHDGEAAWIRHFVQLALVDDEHLLDGDD